MEKRLPKNNYLCTPTIIYTFNDSIDYLLEKKYLLNKYMLYYYNKLTIIYGVPIMCQILLNAL